VRVNNNKLPSSKARLYCATVRGAASGKNSKTISPYIVVRVNKSRLPNKN
jgi:hypothetical protein